ncbi:DNA polymerase III subunit alpha [Candidatus Methylacidiphilum fumarolicum]|uniref:DNA polymerase III subunit alpha n=2 Tax=Candidatus Methylacidiphilum fumarolicum TaxID=591154 RepID=I0JWV7_METFB|nr:DNA polymerase III subunit alpha [Candidatus Methylacidiphilum fumarolicum]MBW6414421.1 DNA polymerase III subunit alpha [Candidatus Methylacidiphilum fumarolicum]TFE69423.1 DNA polymerase III subunit alpha [Candidatus Methylacidiphilum fumarolicum]TFE72871.1 DNA polymerase III subunit alpha [Candidatus Methylacidiphilum fumarolicum]TFE74614.1 DNA polymerase III subunit alpha [Candidatus Methylacidiphilum fumarolicum]TFE77181.1 DNA polymerase III subunit alpha [Candidatus Methylacidiphilum 
MSDGFVHLHLHSEYSLLDASARIKDIVNKAKQLGMPAVALTDHGNLYGTIEFYKACIQENIKPIIGCEAYITAGSRFDRKGSREKIYHITLLAKNQQGYKNLLRLISLSHLEGFYYKPRIDRALLKECGQGIIGTSGCMNGEIPQKILEEDIKAAKNLVEEYSRLFEPDCFYLEIQNHGLKEEATIREVLADFSKSLGLPLVATNDVHYIEQEDSQFHDVLLCIGTASQINDSKRKKYPCAEFYFKSLQQMEELFKEYPQALENTLTIANQCDVTIELGKNRFPAYHPPAPYSQKEYLKKLCYEGLEKRFGDRNLEEKEKIKERLDYELSVIEKTGFSSYFLIVWDFIHYAKKEGIPVGPGRGSAAGSLTAYVLEITDIDPLKYGLVFERFLNPQRVSPPDIDIDFCYNRRSEVIDYVRKKYGERSVAQIITFGTMGAKMAVRDVARVLGLSYQEADRIAKMIPTDSSMTIEKAKELNPLLQQLYAHDPQCQEVLNIASKLEGLTRQAGVHAAGVVISDGDLLDFVPLSRGDHEEIVTQWSMEPISEIGLLKMDFLGLKTLTVISECLELIKKCGENQTLDPNRFPLDDKKTYELLGLGWTIGVFQLESPGMVELAKKLKPGNIEDIIALVALYRPGPMENIPAYAERKLGKVPITYDHPLLEPILKDTYGVMIYQEQVMQAASVLAGYSLGESDLLRRAMGKKKPEEMRKHRSLFVKGCKEKNNIPEEKANQIFETLEKFAGYGFNKAHSACYGYLAYVTAYLKANFPVFYLCTLLSNELGDTEKISQLVSECRRMGIAVLPPDILKSEVRFSVENGAIRWGLSAIKNVGESVAEAIVRARKKHGDFTSLYDLCAHLDCPLNKKFLESLIKSGACDSLRKSRKELLESLGEAMAAGNKTSKERLSGQQSLFEETKENNPNASGIAEEYPLNLRLQWEKELLGIYLSGHPIDEWIPLIKLFQQIPISQLQELADNTRLYIPGIITQIERKTSQKSKKPYVKLMLEDQTGHIEVILFSDTFQSTPSSEWGAKAFIVDGQINKKEEIVSIRSSHLFTIEEAIEHLKPMLYLTITEENWTPNHWKKLHDILLKHPGNAPVVLRYLTKELVCEITTGETFKVNVFPSHLPSLLQELTALLPQDSLKLKFNKSPHDHSKQRSLHYS